MRTVRAMQLAGQTALVTGAAKRVGREIALALARRGANVVVHYHHSAGAARQVVAAIRALGVDALAVCADQTSARQVNAAVARAVRRFGRVDVLVNSAAVYERTPFATLTEREFDFHVNANLKGPYLFAVAVGRQWLRRRAAGKVINVADWAAYRPYRHFLPYMVSKAGVVGLTLALAQELAPRVQVNAVAPGPVLLPPGTGAAERRAVERATLLRRVGSPADVVNAVLYLIEGGDFVTGQVVVVDGGRLMAPGGVGEV